MTLFQTLLLLPWCIMAGLYPTAVPDSAPSLGWSSLIGCVLIFTCISIVDFYTVSYAGQHLDPSQVSLLSFLVPCGVSMGVSLLNLVLSPQGLDGIHHGVSVGVVLAFSFLFLSTVFLTRSPKQSHSVLIGYSAAGLPLYSQQTGKTGFGNWFRPVLGQILENQDSRRILFFLLMNLVRAHSLVNSHNYNYLYYSARLHPLINYPLNLITS